MHLSATLSFSPDIENVCRSQTSLLHCLLLYRAAARVRGTRKNLHPQEQQPPPLAWPLFVWQLSTFDMLQDRDRNEGTPEIPDALVNVVRFCDPLLLRGVFVQDDVAKIAASRRLNSCPNNPVFDACITLQLCSAYSKAVHLLASKSTGSDIDHDGTKTALRWLDIGTGSGLLACLVAAAAASPPSTSTTEVYACEGVKEVADVALETFGKNNFGKVQLFRGHSTEMEIGRGLPSRVHCVISELLGTGQFVRSALFRFLRFRPHRFVISLVVRIHIDLALIPLESCFFTVLQLSCNNSVVAGSSVLI